MRYRIDPQTSRLTAKAFAGGPLSAMGHNPAFVVRDLEGEVDFDETVPAGASLVLVARAPSLSLTGNASEKDRREIERTLQEQVLESARFAEIRYQCSPSQVRAVGPSQLTLEGELTLHGVTRPQPVTVRVNVSGEMLRGQGEARVRQGEYGIKPVSVAGGMLKVKDEVTLTFDIVARRVPGAGGPAPE